MNSALAQLLLNALFVRLLISITLSLPIVSSLAHHLTFRPFQIANVISALLPAVNAMDHLPLIALLVLQALLSSQIIPARVLLLNS